MKKVINFTIFLLSIVFSGCFTGSIKIPGFVIEEKQIQKWGIDSIPVDLVTIDEISIRGNIPFGDLLFNGNILFVGDLAGRIYAISVTDREQIGYFEIKNSQNPFPIAFYDDGLITLNLPKDKNESHLVFYDLINGKVTEKLEFPGLPAGFEKINDTESIIIFKSGRVTSVNLVERSSSSYELNESVSSNMVNNSGTIFSGTYTGKIIVSNTDSKLKEIYCSNSAITLLKSYDNLLFAASDLGEIFVINNDNYTIVKNFNIDSKITDLFLADEKSLIVASGSGDVYLINLEEDTKRKVTNTGGLPISITEYNANLLTVIDFKTGLNFVNLKTASRVNFPFSNRLRKVIFTGKDSLIAFYDNGKIAFLKLIF